MFIDSHCHLDRLDLASYEGSLPAAIAAAQGARVSHFLCISVDLESFPAVLNVAKSQANIFASVGVHPLHRHSENQNSAYQAEQTLTPETLVDLAQSHERIVAIGETGLDYYYCKGDLRWQRERFAVHLQAAYAAQLPVIVHTRDARQVTIDMLRQEKADTNGGVLHCFTEDWSMAKQALDLGFYISISGIVTFNKADQLRSVVKQVPLDRLLIETDSPYLAPKPHRGKSNEPKYLPHVAAKVAELKNLSEAELGEITSNNFFRLFKGAKSWV